MFEVRRIATVLACLGLLAFPSAAGAQEAEDEQQRGGAEEPAPETVEKPAEEPIGRKPAEPAREEPAAEPEAVPATGAEEQRVPPSAEEPVKREEPEEERVPPEEAKPAKKEKPAAKEEAEARPYEEPDKSWISLSGTVAESERDSFTLDYGEGLIVVELDGRDWFDRTNRIMPGEKVRVYGQINDVLRRRRTIEADSVYVFDRQSFFFPDEEERVVYFLTGDPGDLPEGTWVSVSGIVKEIDGREFVLDTGIYDIEVDTDDLGYNPLDDVGLQRINIGDRVYVSGPLDDQFFEDNEILAQTVMTISPGITLLQER